MSGSISSLLDSYGQNLNSNYSTNPTLIENTPSITFAGANGADMQGLDYQALNPQNVTPLGVQTPINTATTEDEATTTTTTTTNNKKYIYYGIGILVIFMMFKQNGD